MKKTEVPIHPAQRDIYTDQLIDITSSQYNIGGYLVLKGPLNKEKFHEAVDFAPRVFDAFKIRFDLHESEPFCYFEQDYEKALMVDLDFSKRINPSDEAKAWMQERFNTAFQLEKDKPLFEQCLIKISDNEHLFFGRYHHLMADGYGFVVWIQYMARKYRSLVAEDGLEFNYPSYYEEVIKSNETDNSRDYELDANYWKEKINTKPQNPLVKKRPKGREDRRSITYILNLTAEQRSLLDKIQLETKSGLQQLTIAALLIYLGKTTEQSEFIFGIPVHKRNSKRLRSVVGTFTGVLPFKGVFQPDEKLADFLKDIIAAQRTDYRHQNYLIGDLARHLKINAADGYLSDIIINYEPLNFELNFGEDIHASIARLTNHDERDPLKVVWRDYNTEQPLQLHIHFSNEYFEQEEIELLAQRLIYILEQFPNKLDENLESIDILPVEEKALIESFNNTHLESDLGKTVLDLFEDHVLKSPDVRAVEYGRSSLTYSELNERSNKLAHLLRSLGVKKDKLVPICIERSIDMVVGIMGVLKAGGAYVPIDPDYPIDRISFMLEDCEASIIISSSESSLKLPSTLDFNVIKLDEEYSSFNDFSSSNSETSAQAEDLAYVIYTSGSTGKPKGVMVIHGGLANLCLAQSQFLELKPGMKTLQFASFGFDASCSEVFNTLTSGGCLVLCSKDDLLSAEAFKYLVHENNVEVVTLPPTYQLVVKDALSEMKVILSAGEPLNESVAAYLQSKKIRVINAYGPTENTVCVTMSDDPITKDGIVVIGKPIANVQVFILDREDELLPIGCIGEIHVAGAQVARGYLNSPSLTSEKFITNPFSNEANARLYKTGDLGRWLPDGNIEYLGRIDDQLKIRGFRIEPKEIESVLEQSELVKQAVVLAKEDKEGNKHLVGYIIADGVFDKQAITTYLEKKLPEYMVPATLVEFESFPTTPSGKIDRKALLEIDLQNAVGKEFVAPRNEFEEKLAAIWEELLGLEKIGIHDNFFELGGDSIISIQLVSRARQLGFELEVGDIFTWQTIAALSGIASQKSAVAASGEQELLTGESGLLPIQQWYLEKEQTDISHYNQSVLVSIDKGVTEAVLTAAVQQLIAYHDALRFKYYKKDGVWKQEYTSAPGELIVEDLRLEQLTSVGSAIARISDTYQRTLNIAEGDLIRVVWIQTPDTEQNNQLLIVIHHLAVDGVSLRILLQHLELLISGLETGKKVDLGQKTTSYRQWYQTLQDYSSTSKLLSQRSFWSKLVTQHTALRVDKEDDKLVRIKDLGKQTVTLAAGETRKLLQEVSGVYGTTINDLLLSALAKTICEFNNSNSIVVGLEGHGRESVADDVDTSNTVGWFTTLFPVLLRVEGDKKVEDWIKSVKEELRQVPDKGLGYGVLKYINKEGSLQGKDPWEIVFNYLGQLDNVARDNKWLKSASAAAGSSISGEHIVNEKLVVNSMVKESQLVLDWSYSTHHYNENTIKELSENYLINLQQIIVHCIEKGKTGSVHTPSDFGLGSVASYKELDKFLDAPFKGHHRREHVESICQLTALQQGILFHGLYDGVSGTYISQFSCDLTSVNLDHFKKAWQIVLKKHSILRSAFYYDAFTVPIQAVYKDVEIPIELLDYRNKSLQEQDDAIKKTEEEDIKRGFDFNEPPLMRLGLIRLNETKYRLLWTFHHILLDGWSMPIVLEEVLNVYESLLSADKNNADIGEDRYEDYVHYIERRDKEQDENYWRKYVNDVQQTTLLPFVKSTADRTKGVGESRLIDLLIDADTTKSIQNFANKNRVTINTVMQGVWSYLLHCYTGSDDIIYGVTVSGRPDDLPNVEQRVGMYINTLPLRSKLNRNRGVVEWLQALQEDQLSSRNHQYTSLAEIQEWAGVSGDLFDSLFVFENYPISEVVLTRQWKLGIGEVRIHDQSNFPLSIGVTSSDKIKVSFSYNTSILNEVYVKEIHDHFEHVLLQMTSLSSGRLQDIKLLTPDKEHQLLFDFNKTAAFYPKDKTIIDLFEEQVLQTPESIALVFNDDYITYAELNARSNQLANYLQNKGVKVETLVPLCVERGVEMVVGILGILKAGGAYVPIDPQYPSDRINYILQDINAQVAITTSDLVSKIQLREDNTIIKLDADWDSIKAEPSRDIKVDIQQNNLVYIIYTSGSTGKPKGVQVEHRGILSLTLNQIEAFRLQPGKKVLQFASFGFDASCSEIFTTLLSGGSLIIPRQEDLLSAEAIVSLIDTHKIDVATLPPSYQTLIKESLPKIPTIISAGEPLNGALAAEIQSQGIRLFNAYGPTENTVCVTMTDSPVLADGTVSIGKPIGNVKVFIVDQQLNAVPIGVPGELCVGGVQVARGYLNRPELTREKFIKNPFNTDEEERIYRTGDIARWLPDGNIEYLGRIDQQIKIAGHRIECGEIESVLSSNELVEEAIVVLNEKEGKQRLAAFYKPTKRVELWPSIAEFFIYDDVVYRSMYEHKSRNDKYRAALQKVIKDKTVLEIGPGPEAVLSRLCLDEGAKHIYAVEILEETYLKAKRCIEVLGLTDKITLIHGDIRDVVLPEKVDYCVSEIVGSIGGSEGSAVLIDIAKKFLKDPSHMIPGRSTTKIAALTLDESTFEYGFSDVAYQYVEKIEDAIGEGFEFRLCLKNMPKQNIISSEDVFEDLDYCNKLDYNLIHDITLSITKESIFNGFVVWMDLFVDEQNHLDIIEDQGSWLPVYFPVSYPGIAVVEGDIVKAQIIRKLSSNNLNPDFYINGSIIKIDGSIFEFEFTSLHHEVASDKSDFFAKLFEDGKAKRLPKLDAQYLREYAGEFLPEYMIPTAFIPLENIPLTPNGKVDRIGLMKRDFEVADLQKYVAPNTSSEEELVKIWEKLLGLEQVSIYDNFFELGGHSLLAMQLVSAIRSALKAELTVKDLFENPTVAALADHIAKQSQQTILSAIEVGQRPKYIPLSFSQERLWFIHQLEGSVQYHSPGVLRLKGSLNRNALKFALKTLIERHEVLRTVFLEKDGLPYQHVNDNDQWNITISNGSVYKEDTERLQQYVQQLISHPFDLSREPMMRANLIELDEQEHLLIVVTHHIASDAWSLPIIIREIAELYASYVEDRQPELSPLKLQYADYAIWQRKYLTQDVLENKLNYWKKKLEGAEPLRLPLDHSRPAIRSNRGSSATFKINKSLSQQLNELSSRQGGSLYITLLAAFNVMLYRYTGQNDISVGTSVANRTRQEIEDLVGFFVNTLTFRNDVNGNESFLQLLQQVKTTALEAYEHQEVPFEKVVEAVVKERDSSMSPLFQVMLVLVNTPEVPELRLGDVTLSPGSYQQATVKFDITFFVTETADGLQGVVEYSSDLFEAGTIERMMSHFTTLIESVVKDPTQKVGLLPMLSDEEKQNLLSSSNHNVSYPKNKTIVSLFEEQVLKAPQETAVVFEDEELTYEQLNAKANQLAHYLRQRGVKEDTLVPVYVERSHKLIISVMAIMKAGAAYVPIDTDFPAERISYMLKDCASSFVISSKESRSKLEIAEQNIDIIEVDGHAFANQSTSNVVTSLHPHHLAYVIYTSGSTGTPKGVMVEHRNLVDYVFGLNQKIQVDQCQSYALVSSIATDLGNTVIYSSLVFGGALHLFSKESVSNIEYLHRYFQSNKIDCLKIVPSHWKALKNDEELLLPNKLLVFGGEALQTDLVENISESGAICKVINHYGPTETTIGKLLHVTDTVRSYNSTIPIGKPFSNTEVYVLSKELQLAPAGVAGQLYIAGDGVARGYLNNDDLTKQKFIQNPFGSEGVSVMYGTGDLVKVLADGNIQFLGRVDDQVKIRGYRVELGEIESVLQQSELVNHAVVVAKEDKQGNKQLVAYVVAEDGWFDREGILSYLKEKLPEYMVPAMLVEMESLPLTANGKVNRKALPEPEATETSAGGYMAPRNDAEERLSVIWQDVLEEDQVGVHDNFFELGGHSLLAVRLVSAIRKEFAVELPISHVFDYPTIALLAAELGVDTKATVLPPIQVIHPRPARIPLSFSQERLWFIDKLEGSVQYHVPAVVRLKGNLNKDALRSALQEIVQRHEVLRTVFQEENGQAFQVVKNKNVVGYLDVEGVQFKNDAKALSGYIKELINQPFNLCEDDMLRAELITLSDDEYILVVTLHHIASDGWSTSILVKELVELYAALEQGQPVKLDALPVQYVDFALWQRNYLQGDVLANKLQYWKDKLQNVEPLQLPLDFARPASQRTAGAKAKFKIEKSELAALQQLNQQHGVTMFMTLLAAFKVLLFRYTGQNDICVGTPIAGRQQQELEKLIGFFLNTLALRTSVDSQSSFEQILREVRTTTMEAFEHQEVPFEKVVEAVVKNRDMSRSPLFQVMFVMQNTPDVQQLQLGELELVYENLEHETAKFEIVLSVAETEDGLTGAFEYNTDLFSAATISRMISHFQTLIVSILNAPGKSVISLPLLPAAEQQQLLEEFSSNIAEYPKDDTIVSKFEEQVTKTPTNIALVYEGSTLTYQELNEKANRLAHYLKAKGIQKEALVPICIERGLSMIVGILGILKAGGVYVPIDPEYPVDRIRYMLEDVAATIVVTSKQSRVEFDLAGNLDVVEIDDERAFDSYSGENLNLAIDSDNLAYIIYTSGSTGTPKGAMIEHRNLISLFEINNSLFDFNEKDVWTMLHSFCFDFSVWEMYGALFYGGKLVVVPSQVTKDVSLIADLLISEKVTVLNQTPSAFYVLQDYMVSKSEVPATRYVIFGGEALNASRVQPWKSNYPSCKLINMYGITETTVHVTYQEINWEQINGSGSIIGKTIPTLKAYILDAEQQLSPIGVAGEIYVGGAGLARGYLNRPELTAQRFIEDTFSKKVGERLYRTGDLGRWLNDGTLEYLGRIDDQVKVRGYRIELGEIESVLLKSALVRQAVVLAKDDKQGSNLLVGYVVADNGFDKQAVIKYLQERLPAYMVPAIWVQLESLPLTSNGKLNRKLLPDVDASESSTEVFVAPSTDVEIKLANIWQQLLNVNQISINDDFFELGGHSLLIMRLVASIEQEFGIEVPIKDLFSVKTIKDLSKYLEVQLAINDEQGDLTEVEEFLI